MFRTKFFVHKHGLEDAEGGEDVLHAGDEPRNAAGVDAVGAVRDDLREGAGGLTLRVRRPDMEEVDGSCGGRSGPGA